MGMESIGRVIKVHGVVNRVVAGERSPLSKGDHLAVGDKIISEKASVIKFMMKDDTIFQMGPHSEFVLKKFDFKTKSERTAIYNLVRGKLRSLFTVKSKTRSLKIITPTASMAIRGTEILSDVFKHQGIVTTNIALLSGKLEIQSRGSKKRIMINPGFVYQSSLNKIKSHSAHKISIERMNKRVFHMAKNSQKKDELFLHDMRKKVDKKLVEDIKFEILESRIKPLRIPANGRRNEDIPKPDRNSKERNIREIRRMKRQQEIIRNDIEQKRSKKIEFIKQRNIQPPPKTIIKPTTAPISGTVPNQ